MTWRDATPYSADSSATGKNNFQLLLVDRANGDFDIVFNYGTIEWNTPSYNSNPAKIGYANGRGTFQKLPNSASDPAALTDQRYILQIRNGGETSPIPEPETFAMLLAGLGIVTAMARRHRKND